MPSSHSRPLDSALVVVSAQANPIRLAWKLARLRRVRHLFANRGRATWSITAFVLLGMPVAVAAWQQLRAHGATVLSPLQAHPIATAIIAAAIAWAATMRSRRRIETQLTRSWLASAPVSARDRRAALRWRVGIEVITPIAVVLAALACAGLASGISIAGLLALAAILMGAAAGVIAGWYAGAKPPRSRAASSLRLRPSRVTTSLAASLAPLGRWPFAQLRAAASPRVEAPLIGALLLSLPIGIPPSIALPILAFAANALAAFSLLRALLATIPAAADWLRATPLGVRAFARAACLRAGTWQVAFAVLGGMIAHALGAPTSSVGLLAAAWLGVCVTATASALACRHRPARLMTELAGIGALLLAIVSVAPLMLALALPALWLWQSTRMRNA